MPSPNRGIVEQEADALIYVMNRSSRRMPMLAYLNTIKEGFDNFGLDQAWLRAALVDTKQEAATQASEAAKQWTAGAGERKARYAREDAEQDKRRRGQQHYMGVSRPSPHRHITDMFDEAEQEMLDGVYGDGEVEWEPEYIEPRELPPRLYTKQDYIKAAKTLERHNKSRYKQPKSKSPHLFDEPYYPGRQKVKS